MPLHFTTDPKKLIQHMIRVLQDVPRIAGVEGEKFFKESFRKQGWEDRIFTSWKARKGDKQRRFGESSNGRGILIKSGALRRSIRVIMVSKNYVIIGSSLPYSKIHNEGGTIEGSFTVKSHKRRRNSTGGKKGNKRGGSSDIIVKEHERQMNTKIPRRQFMGNSRALTEIINKEVRYRMKMKHRL